MKSVAYLTFVVWILNLWCVSEASHMNGTCVHLKQMFGKHFRECRIVMEVIKKLVIH